MEAQNVFVEFFNLLLLVVVVVVVFLGGGVMEKDTMCFPKIKICSVYIWLYIKSYVN